MNRFGSLGSHGNRGNTSKPIPYTSRNKLRSYNFTLNNYTITEADHLAQEFLKLKCLKFAFQEEIGLKNKIPHLQGCVFFKSQISFNTMKKINGRVHWSKLDYPKKAIEYCLKESSRKPEGKRWTHGIIVTNYIKDPPLGWQEMLDVMKDQMLKDNDIAGDWLKLEKKRFGNKYDYLDCWGGCT